MSVKKNSVILLQGIFDPALFDLLKKNEAKNVFILEGRPTLEAARQSCHELLKRKIKPMLMADNMAGFLFYKELVKEVWISYEFADESGALCQIGGLILGVLGYTHKVPVYVSPSNCITPVLGAQKDISYFNGVKVAPTGTPGYVPLVEWVPKKYIGKTYGQ